jgi:hypothetical protein
MNSRRFFHPGQVAFQLHEPHQISIQELVLPPQHLLLGSFLQQRLRRPRQLSQQPGIVEDTGTWVTWGTGFSMADSMADSVDFYGFSMELYPEVAPLATG